MRQGGKGRLARAKRRPSHLSVERQDRTWVIGTPDLPADYGKLTMAIASVGAGAGLA